MEQPLITLVSIVKNEEAILQRMIDSVKDVVDDYCIVDTGSTDRTKEIISKYQEVIEIPFVNYVDTKNEALKRAKGKYILFMDADEVLYEGHAVLKEWAQEGRLDGLNCKITEGGQDYSVSAMEYNRMRMWANNGKWRFEGPGVHECLIHDGTGSMVIDLRVRVRHDHHGKHNDSEKFFVWRDLLLKHLEKDPMNLRALFYLGRTYRDINEKLLAIDSYKKYLSVKENNYKDEKWQSAYDIAGIYKDMGDYESAIEFCGVAESIDNRRCEHLNMIGNIYFVQKEYKEAIKFFELACARPMPNDIALFVNPLEYTLYCHDQLFLSYYHDKQYKKAEEKCKQLSGKPYEERVLNNLWWARAKTGMNIFMNLGNTPEPIYGGILNVQGVHGVETTYIELSKWFYNLGHNVFLFCTTSETHCYEGVWYIPYEEYDNYVSINPDVAISSRWFESFNKVPTAKKIMWFQDAYPPLNGYDFDKADQIIVSSKWHYNYIMSVVGGKIAKGKMKIIPLGIDKSLFKGNKNRYVNKVLYSSNPNRGLDILADMWGEIVKSVPDIQLDILYGWEGLKTWSNDTSWQNNVEKEQKDVIDKFNAVGNVKYSGRVTKKVLAEKMMESSMLLFPCTFDETFCLTALEAQIAGMVIVTTDVGALRTTVDNTANVKLKMSPKTKEYKNRFIDSVVTILNDRRDWVLRSSYNRNKYMNEPCDWKDIAEIWEKNIWEL